MEGGRVITVVACLWFSMAMVGWLGSGMKVVDDMHAGKGRRLVACREIPEHIPRVR